MKIHYPLSLAAFFAIAPQVLAQESHDQKGQEANLPCVEVQIGQDVASQMNCLNAAMQHMVEQQHAEPVPEVPITAQSASNEVGTFNEAAARQMMGNAFGVSPQPQRPRNSFTNPLIHLPH